jgi:putative ABC transport system permease protein
MIKNLLLVALRNFRRDKWYSLLNILGLTIGITFSLFLIFYIKDELSYDRYNEKAGRIYRINAHIKEPDKDTMRWAVTPFPMAPALAKDYPEVEEAVRFIGIGKVMYKNGDLRLYEDKVFAADSNLFRVFTHKFIEGDPQTALKDPKSMVLTKSGAKKFFGTKSCVGKALEDAKGDCI